MPDEVTVHHYALEVKTTKNPNWVVVSTKENADDAFTYKAFDDEGPDFEFRVIIHYSDGSKTLDTATPTLKYVSSGTTTSTDYFYVGDVEDSGSITVEGKKGGKLIISYLTGANNQRVDSDLKFLVLQVSLDDGLTFKVVDSALASEKFEYYAMLSDAPEWKFKVQGFYNDGTFTNLAKATTYTYTNANPGSGTGPTPVVTKTRCRVLGLVMGAVTIETIPLASVSVDLTGQENLKKRWQGEYSFVASVKGYAWNEDEGGKSPNNEKLRTKDSWSCITTSHKDTAGVCLVTS